MGWLIGRAEAVSNPQAAKQKALAKLRHCAELDDPESLVVPILVDAFSMIVSSRSKASTLCISSGTKVIW